MKQSVKFSPYALFITICSLTILIAIMLMLLRDGKESAAYVFAGVIVLICLLSLFYAPISVSVDGHCLNVNRKLRTRSIAFDEIESIRLCPPTMGECRVCGSGGWFGYWGWCHDRELGRYFAYYGKSSDCFLVRLRNGRSYVIGCQNPQTIVDEVCQKISR